MLFTVLLFLFLASVPALAMLLIYAFRKRSFLLIWLSVPMTIILDLLCVWRLPASDPFGAVFYLTAFAAQAALLTAISALLVFRNRKLGKALPEQELSVRKKEKKIIAITAIAVCAALLVFGSHVMLTRHSTAYSEASAKHSVSWLAKIKPEKIRSLEAYGNSFFESDPYDLAANYRGDKTFLAKLEYAGTIVGGYDNYYKYDTDNEYQDSDTYTVSIYLKNGGHILMNYCRDDVFVVVTCKRHILDLTDRVFYVKSPELLADLTQNE